ncbi:unnamed protein product [Cuscuta epithymum]|uniref:DUF1664 domain-containing protein n=1 Tax=Cuscuta epithymum TaxID=186058 RepID=A0AAV0G2K6_9ASTE|nr:unnamed protein product [Cuscuta epithymum]
MAMQAGMGFSKIVILLGAGYTTTLLVKNGKLSDVLAELQNLVKNHESSGEGTETEAALAAQVRRLAMEVRSLTSSRPITVLNGGSSGNLTNLVAPAAALGVLGYGYMWLKGISFSDLMYVTKSSMANAVSNLTKHLQHVSDALAATKKHLTQRIQNVDGKLDDQIEISKHIRAEVSDVRGDLSKIDNDVDAIQMMLSGLDGRLLSLEEKQEIANAGVMYLCGNLHFMEKLNRGGGDSVGAIMGLRDIMGVLESSETGLRITDGSAVGGSPMSTDPPRNLIRRASMKC